MTYQGGIDELRSLENNSSMPDWFKPTLKKVRETMEMDGKENVTGEWIGFDYPYIGNQCSVCRSCFKQSGDDYNFCPNCGAYMKGE